MNAAPKEGEHENQLTIASWPLQYKNLKAKVGEMVLVLNLLSTEVEIVIKYPDDTYQAFWGFLLGSEQLARGQRQFLKT